MSLPLQFARRDVKLSEHTTIGLGGPARLFASCGTVEEVRAALSYARSTETPVQVIAGGSNVVFADEGYDGMVMKIDLRGLQVDEAGGEVRAVLSAGEPWDGFVAHAVEKGWGGIECLSGIPGSVGATPVQNVGAYGQEVSETIIDVTAIERASLRDFVFSAHECGFGYRESRFKGVDSDRFVITGVRFRLRPNAAADVRYPELKRSIAAGVDLAILKPGRETLGAVRSAVLSLRRKKSMVIDPADENTRSVGSFFTNPVMSHSSFERLQEAWKSMGDGSDVPSFPTGERIKVPAAWLVEKSGFTRGFQKGRAGISAHHTLALVNRNGTTRELIELATEIESAVENKFGIRLYREPVVIPYTQGEH